jgi:hypothetical protein
VRLRRRGDLARQVCLDGGGVSPRMATAAVWATRRPRRSGLHPYDDGAP